LSPLTSEETLEYINYRLIKAGKGFLKLSEGFLKPLYKFSAGVPRIINIVSSRAIMSAYLEGSNIVTSKHVNYAIKHFKDSESPRHRKSFLGLRPLYALFILGVLALAAATGYYYVFVLQKDKSVEVIRNVTQSVEQSPVEQRPTPVADTDQSKSIKEVKQETTAKSIQKDIRAVAPEDLTKQIRTATVIVNAANLRSRPSFHSKPISWTSKGVVFEVKDEFTEITGKKWYKIKLSDGRECWIADTVVKVGQK
jgi:hypothetical protein